MSTDEADSDPPTPPAAARAIRVVAPTGSMRQQFVVTRLAATLELERPVLLVNLNPMRELYAPSVLAMGGTVLTPSGPVCDHRDGGNPRLHYVTLADENRRAIADPVDAVAGLVMLAPRHTTSGALLILDGCQALAARGRTAMRALAVAAQAGGCDFVAIGSQAADTECIADLCAAQVKLPSKYDLRSSAVSAEWLVSSRSWAPTTPR